jgi:hypothetical protein
MSLKLQEKPREWQKFTCSLMAALSLAAFLMYRKHALAWPVAQGVWILAVAVAVVCLLWPAPFRGLYRAGMTVGFYVGQVVGRVLLTLVFFGVFFPLGWLLRLGGKDLLNLKKPGAAETYWQTPPPKGQHDRPF